MLNIQLNFLCKCRKTSKWLTSISKSGYKCLCKKTPFFTSLHLYILSIFSCTLLLKKIFFLLKVLALSLGHKKPHYNDFSNFRYSYLSHYILLSTKQTLWMVIDIYSNIKILNNTIKTLFFNIRYTSSHINHLHILYPKTFFLFCCYKSLKMNHLFVQFFLFQ